MWRKCTNGWKHTWEKWHPSWESSAGAGFGSRVDIRRCVDCGFKQNRWTSV